MFAKDGRTCEKGTSHPSPDTITSSRLVTLDASKASKSTVKKKPAISSPKPTKSSRLVVLDVHTASNSSSTASSESEKEIERLGD